MQATNDRAFKEWAVSCAAMREGRQILLIRKGGIREEGGVFTLADREFWLMPTYEHQKAALLQPEWQARLAAEFVHPPNVRETVLQSYAVVDTIVQARDEAQVNALSDFHLWNADFVRGRFDFNPYDPLYLLLLRVYNRPAPVTLPLLSAYVGCKSWVTLDHPLSTAELTPALADHAFARLRLEILARLGEQV